MEPAAYSARQRMLKRHCDEPCRAYGIDPATIITILLPIIIEMIKKCQDQSSNKLARYVKNDDPWTRLRLRRAIRKYETKVAPDANERKFRDGVHGGFRRFAAETPHADMTELISEARSNGN
jgi:hypothetical protein